MPPTVARLAVEMSGANFSRWGSRCAFSSSSTMPGSTRAQRSATFTSSTRLKYLAVSNWSPAPMACPACEVPPPRAVIGTPCRRAMSIVRTTSSRGSDDDDPGWLDLIHAGVGGVQGASDSVEAHVALDRGLQVALQPLPHPPSIIRRGAMAPPDGCGRQRAPKARPPSPLAASA